MREHAVVIGGQTPLLGVVTEPEHVADKSLRTGVVLLNSGLIHRVGPNRLYVNLARRLARQGLTTLRFDLSAIGDSPQRRDSLPFRASSLAETAAAVDFLRQQWGVRRFVLGGICTGAVVSFRAALQDPAIVGLLLINAQGLISNPSAELQESIADRADARYYLVAAVRNRESWICLFSGSTDYGAIARSFAQQVKKAFRRTTTARSPEQLEIVNGVGRLIREHRRLLLLYSDSDPGLDELEVIFGSKELAQVKQAPEVSFRVINRSDHMFTAVDRQEEFLNTVCAWLLDAAFAGSSRSGPR